MTNRTTNSACASAFTLLEVMVATMIVGISFGAICSLMAQAIRSAEVTGRYSRAVILAQSKLDELMLRGKLDLGLEQGEFSDEPGFAWQLRVDPAQEKGMAKVRLTVMFTGPGGKREVVLNTLQSDRGLPKKDDGKNMASPMKSVGGDGCGRGAERSCMLGRGCNEAQAAGAQKNSDDQTQAVSFSGRSREQSRN